MTKAWGRTGCAAFTIAAFLSACGGGGEEAPGTAATPPASTTVEGFWTGKNSTGWDIAVAILETGETWGVITSGGVIYAALQGSTTSSGGTLSGSVREFDLRNGSISSTTYTGTYVARARTDVRFPSGDRFTGQYSTSYDQPASLAAVAGAYTGSGVITGAPVQALGVSITATGTVTLPASPGCSSSGTLTPRASGKNIFNLRMTFIGPNCALGNGATASGVAVYDNGALLAMGLLPSQTAGFIFTGRK